MTAIKPARRYWLTRVSSAAVPSGIYGTVICASILASVVQMSAGTVAVVVVVTLIVYWLAERYAEVLGLAAGPDRDPPPTAGQKITAAHVRTVLHTGWPMIQASVTPLVVMLLSRLLGASSELAVDIALIYTILLLVALGWLAATRALLVGWPRVAAAGFAAILGLIVVGLKASLH